MTTELELESTAGGTRRLSQLRGRVVVLFWEAREHTSDNAELKSELGRLGGSDPSLVQQVALVAVGDVSAFDVTGARPVARAALSAIARLAGVEIWLDWKLALTAPPFSVVRGRSNVLVLDREGQPVLRRSGRLGARERAEVIEAVRARLGDRTSAESAE